MCTGHCSQVCTCVAACVSEKYPALQFEHTYLFKLLLYWPGLQTSHVVWSEDCAYPSTQKQLRSAPEPTPDVEFSGHLRQLPRDVDPLDTEYVLVGQNIHSDSPIGSLYVPGTHCVHDSPLFPVEPALQVQCVIEVLSI